MKINLDGLDQTQLEFLEQYNQIYQRLKQLNFQIDQLQFEAGNLINELEKIRNSEKEYNQKHKNNG